jgi:hypothetical protein
MEIAHRLQNVDLRGVAAAGSERDGTQAAAKLAELSKSTPVVAKTPSNRTMTFLQWAESGGRR